MTEGRHRDDLAADAPTTPLPAVRPADPADLEHWEILLRPAVADQLDRPGLIERLFVRLWPGERERTARLAAEADAWSRAWRSGGTRTGRRLSRTLRQRGLMLAKRAGRQARRLRSALAREGRA